MLFSSAWYLTLEAEGLKRLREGSLSCVWMSNTLETAIKCSADYFQRICLVRDDAVKVTRLPRKCWWLIKGKAGGWTRVTQETGALRDVKSLCRHWDNELILTSVIQELVLLRGHELHLGDSSGHDPFGGKPWDSVNQWPPIVPREKLSSVPQTTGQTQTLTEMNYIGDNQWKSIS